ncbi:MAG: 3-dehydroquinate synthase [Clostridia bacterium]|nr:3-dehydroquinate synthase [Clostridia bacterium]
MQVISLNTPSTASKIYIGKNVIESRLPVLTSGQKNFVVTDSNVYALYGDFFAKYFKSAEIFVLPAGEENKNFASLQAILEKMSVAGLHRSSRLFAVGGGVIGDIGGLAAALYMRGISCVQIPTTLLAQVDSSVGGKTAIDLGGMKNIVGAFYQPQEVLVDPTFLNTLPPREMKCGLGEIVKYAALNGEIFDRLEKGFDGLVDLIAACIEHKARVVERDEKESGERKSLNVGHTTGHAIELTSGLSHGECVLYGTWLETKMAIAAGVCEREYGERLLKILKRALKVEPLSLLDFSDIRACAQKAKSDKKNADDDKIVTSVAKAKNEWTVLSLPFEEYCAALEKAVVDWKREGQVCDQ